MAVKLASIFAQTKAVEPGRKKEKKEKAKKKEFHSKRKRKKKERKEKRKEKGEVVSVKDFFGEPVKITNVMYY